MCNRPSSLFAKLLAVFKSTAFIGEKDEPWAFTVRYLLSHTHSMQEVKAHV